VAATQIFVFLIFTPKIGEMIQFDVRIFFRWVGSTTNKIRFFRLSTFFFLGETINQALGA